MIASENLVIALGVVAEIADKIYAIYKDSDEWKEFRHVVEVLRGEIEKSAKNEVTK